MVTQPDAIGAEHLSPGHTREPPGNVSQMLTSDQAFGPFRVPESGAQQCFKTFPNDTDGGQWKVTGPEVLQDAPLDLPVWVTT